MLENAGLEKEKFPLLLRLVRKNGRLTRGEGRSETVAALQNLLKSHGYRIEDGNGRNRGIYGLQTERTVKKFQRENSLAVSGVADATTIRLLLEKPRESFKFGQGVNPSELTDHSRKILQEILDQLGISSAIITSMGRNPYNQARVMYDNEVNGQSSRYARGGEIVLQLCRRLIREGKSRDEVIAAMQAKIEELGPRNVSHHACDPRTPNVIDIAPSSIPTNKRRAFVEAFQAAKRLGIVDEFFKPPEDFAYHIEIRQP